jgi:CheY-like chemotaxis protein
MEIPRVSRQILVVEDSTEVRRAIIQVLEMEHYTVHQAEHGKAAMKKVEAMTPGHLRRVHEVQQLSVDRRGAEIRCLKSQLWVTQNSDLCGHVLIAGEKMKVTHRGAVVMQALKEESIFSLN